MGKGKKNAAVASGSNTKTTPGSSSVQTRSKTKNRQEVLADLIEISNNSSDSECESLLDFLTEKIRNRNKRAKRPTVARSTDDVVANDLSLSSSRPIPAAPSVVSAPLSYPYSSGVGVNSAASWYSPTVYPSSSMYPLVSSSHSGYQAPLDIHRQAPLVTSSVDIHRAPLGAYAQVPLATTYSALPQQAPFAASRQVPLVSSSYLHQAPLGDRIQASPATQQAPFASPRQVPFVSSASYLPQASLGSHLQAETTAQLYQAPLGEPAQAPFVSTKPVCTPPKYNGSSDLSVFINKFETVCRLNGWVHDETKMLWLSSCLEGDAAKLLDEKFNSYQLMTSALERSFGSMAKKRSYERILSRRKRQTNEELAALAADIRRMVKIVYSEDAPPTQERMCLRHFSNALNNVHSQWELARHDFHSLDEAVQFATEREAFFGRDEGNKIRAVENKVEEVDSTAELHKEVKNLTALVSKMLATSNNSGSKPNNQQGKPKRKGCRHCSGPHPSYVCDPCHHCGGPHYNNQCTTKSNSAPKNQTANASSAQGNENGSPASAQQNTQSQQ